jgi:hypothetical protein
MCLYGSISGFPMRQNNSIDKYSGSVLYAIFLLTSDFKGLALSVRINVGLKDIINYKIISSS